MRLCDTDDTARLMLCRCAAARLQTPCEYGCIFMEYGAVAMTAAGKQYSARGVGAGCAHEFLWPLGFSQHAAERQPAQQHTS
jgi:hypothetical protein